MANLRSTVIMAALVLATADATADRGPGAAPPPDQLRRDDITAAIAAIKPALDACRRPGASGIIKVSVGVAPSGAVARFRFREPPRDPALGACVEAAVRTATFRRTTNGGTFSYPFRY